MKKLIALIFLTGIVFADNTDTVRTRLCDYWKYDFQANAYSCSYLSKTVNLVEATRHEETVSRLEAKIADLEKRIETLEGK